MILTGLNSIDKLDKLEAYKQKKHKEKTRREPQLLVSSGVISAPADTPQVYLLVDLSNPFENLDFAIFANYDLSDPFWLDQGIGFSIP
jgi:hypothetical protein